MNNKYFKKPTLFNYLTGSVIAIVSNNFTKKSTASLATPKVVNGYNLEKVLTKKMGFTNFSTGIYANKTKKVFIKTWQGKLKDINYYLLVNEYLTMIRCAKAAKKITNSAIALPALIDFAYAKNQFSIIYEYIDGKPLATFSQTKQVETLTKTIDFLRQVSQKLSVQDKQYFTKRSGIFYLLSLPFITGGVLFSSLSNGVVILKVFGLALINYPSAVRHPLLLAHADLNPQNIIMQGKTAYLLDGERLRLTLPYFDRVHMLVAKGNAKIRKLLVKSLQAKLPQATRQFLTSYLCLQYLLSTNHAKVTKQYYLQLLKTV